MPEITVYTTDLCGYCNRVKSLLQSHGLDYREINLSRNPEGRVELARRTGMMTFPQVLINDTLVGGFAETLTAVQSGRLDGRA